MKQLVKHQTQGDGGLGRQCGGGGVARHADKASVRVRNGAEQRSEGDVRPFPVQQDIDRGQRRKASGENLAEIV